MNTLVLNDRQINQKLQRIAYEILENNSEDEVLYLIGIKGNGFLIAQKLKEILSPITEQVVKVAVKIITHGGSEDVELVQNEVRMHEKLFAGGGSPLLVRLFDVLFEEAQSMLVLELCEHRVQLYEHIDAAPQGRLSEAAAAPIVRELAAALAFMHSKQVAHLDVKPENILVASHRHLGLPAELKLVDYGSACAMDLASAPESSLGLVKDRGGTDRCMAPERRALPNGWFSGAPADIYSLGCVALHMLLGEAAADELAKKTAVMAKAAEAAATARARVSKAAALVKSTPRARAVDDSVVRARQISLTMSKAAESAASLAGPAAVQSEAKRAEPDVLLSAHAMDVLLSATRVEASERPTVAELLRHDWLLERASNLPRSSFKGGAAR